MLIALIRVYQWTLAPLWGACCRFEPSCSRYTVSCIQHQGPLRGLWCGVRRLMRCHPFSPGGYDPPPFLAGGHDPPPLLVGGHDLPPLLAGGRGAPPFLPGGHDPPTEMSS
ncbi:MAG TPA: membrane protein insertion efficiency factor YidD [Polyangiaceae bacterium]|nr:membrane protein insertion efficiency factor YidD [Polyangiaceae bacterium]